jgi:thiamine biosynthesis protein ThiS
MAAAATKLIQIVVNGQVRQAPEGQALADLLVFLEIDPARVAVELNRSIISRPDWGKTAIEPGSKLEIVQFVGGG